MTPDAWKKLKRKVAREKRAWENTSLNKPGRDVAAGVAGAYGGVLRMMERIEAAEANAERKS